MIYYTYQQGDTDMAVHRLDDNAEALLQKLAKEEGMKPGEWLSQLVKDYAKGKEFKPVQGANMN